MTAFRRLAERAGLRLHIPEAIGSLCCGTPWSSKGYTAGDEIMASRVREILLAATVGSILL